MSVVVVGVDVVVVVLPLLVAAVVWGVDVNAVDRAAAGKCQRFEDVVVLAADHDVIRTPSAGFDGSARPKTGIDRISELRDYDEVGDVSCSGHRFLGRRGTDQCRPAIIIGPLKGSDDPGVRVEVLIQLSTRRTKYDLVAAADAAVR